ncbi:MAG: nucleotidyltransferase family protein [Zetaproteobacteria bacterium]|nr:nucleotidyltransferase family protein [Zetaproteobacteria bacterium]
MQAIEQAIILAAGRGTRLKWLTEKHPKPLMKIRDDYAIVHVIRALVAQGVKDIAINVHHHGQQIIDALGNGDHFGVRLHYSIEQQLLDSGGGVRTALAQLPHHHGDILVHNADILTHIDLRFMQKIAVDTDAVLAMVPNPPHHTKGDFTVVEDRVEHAGEPTFTFSGISIWQRAWVQQWPLQQNFSLVEKMREAMQKGRCGGFIHHGVWLDIGRPKDLMRANQYRQTKR